MLNESLRQVMTQGYLYVEEHESAGKALGVMRDMRISCVFVLDGDKPIGIITERKIVKRAVEGVNLTSALARDIMSQPLITLGLQDSVRDACTLMREKEIRHIGVIDSYGRLRGTVTPSNIVNVLGMESFSSTATVKEVMNPNLVALEEQASLKDAVQEILEWRTCCAVIMKDGYPTGVISEKDAVRCLGYGHNIVAMPVQKVMSSPVVGIEERESVAQAIITLRRHRIHRLVVYDGKGKVSGILALINLVRNIDKIVH